MPQLFCLKQLYFPADRRRGQWKNAEALPCGYIRPRRGKNARGVLEGNVKAVKNLYFGFRDAAGSIEKKSRKSSQIGRDDIWNHAIQKGNGIPG